MAEATKEKAGKDELTGLLNKTAVIKRLKRACREAAGYYMLIDIDSFIRVNDKFGRDQGDQLLKALADILQKSFGEDSTIGRIGPDQFAVFSPDLASENDVSRLTVNLNVKLLTRAKELFGPDMDIPLGVSVGAVYVSGIETKYGDVSEQAEKALARIKQSSKHGYCIYTYEEFESDDESRKIDIKKLSMILGERTIQDAALQLDMDSFVFVYRFVMRYIIRYQKEACKLLFTLSPFDGKGGSRFEENCDLFVRHIRGHLRKSDLVMQYRKNQIFILLTAIREDNVSQVIANILHSWNVDHEGTLSIQCETEFIIPDEVPRQGDGEDGEELPEE